MRCLSVGRVRLLFTAVTGNSGDSRARATFSVTRDVFGYVTGTVRVETFLGFVFPATQPFFGFIGYVE
jgi:hypothetical protein